MGERAGGSRVAVVGAGVVGLATALYLQRDGHRVSLHDKGGPGEGASYGNAGILAVGSVLPVGLPGLARRVPGMLLDPLGPLTIRWSYLPQITPWLLRMLRHSGREEVERIAGALASLSLPALLVSHPHPGDQAGEHDQLNYDERDGPAVDRSRRNALRCDPPEVKE